MRKLVIASPGKRWRILMNRAFAGCSRCWIGFGGLVGMSLSELGIKKGIVGLSENSVTFST
jgi:hypothetical protein